MGKNIVLVRNVPGEDENYVKSLFRDQVSSSTRVEAGWYKLVTDTTAKSNKIILYTHNSEGGNPLNENATLDFNRPMQKNLNIELPTECENLNGHQLKALAWLKWRESKKSIKIGIFVDDMNLGKIAMMTALALSAKETATNTPKGTLVICPSTTSLEDWVNGVKDICNDDQLNVLAYNNEANAETTIARRITAEGITAELTTKSFVVTTYSTLRENLNCFKEKKSMKNKKKITWSRIILDDVHKYAERAEVKEAVFALDTGMRWCVTGTSVQDNEIFYFLEFLIKPFNNAEMWSTCINSTNEHGKDIFDKIMESLVLRLTNKDVNDVKKVIELLKSKALEAKRKSNDAAKLADDAAKLADDAAKLADDAAKLADDVKLADTIDEYDVSEVSRSLDNMSLNNLSFNE